MDRTLRGLNASTCPNIVTISIIIIIILIAFPTRLSAASSCHLFPVHCSQPPKGVQGGQPPSTDERQRLTDGWCELGAGVAAVAVAALAAAAVAALMAAAVTAATAVAAMAAVSLAILSAGLAVGHLRWETGCRGIGLQEIDLRATDFQEIHLRDTTVSHSSSSSSSLWRLILPLSSRKHCPRAR